MSKAENYIFYIYKNCLVDFMPANSLVLTWLN